MAYGLDQFIADCRTNSFARSRPCRPRTGARDLERLLANPDFVSEYCGDDAPRGLKVLYEDPKLGFQMLAHINDKARVSPPHDHGDSWAIYGQATKYTDMIEWAREDDGKDPKHAKLKPVKKYRLTPGKAGIYQNGAIHSIDYPDYARFVRVTGTNLDTIDRIRIDLKTGEVERDDRTAGDVNLSLQRDLGAMRRNSLSPWRRGCGEGQVTRPLPLTQRALRADLSPRGEVKRERFSGN